MENKELLTIKEFAKIAGITVQSVYQRLDTSLKDYLQIVKGQKYLKIQALKDIYNIDYCKDDKQINKQSDNDLIQDFKRIFKYQKDLIDLKNEQIADLKKQIEELKSDKLYLQNELSKSNDRFAEQQQIIKLITLPKQIETVEHDQEDKKGFFKFFKS